MIELISLVIRTLHGPTKKTIAKLSNWAFVFVAAARQSTMFLTYPGRAWMITPSICFCFRTRKLIQGAWPCFGWQKGQLFSFKMDTFFHSVSF